MWFDIPGFPNYQISKSSVIRKKSLVSRGNGKLILTPTSGGRYLGVKIKNEEGEWKRVHIHVIMMLVFVGLRPEGLVINHKDGDKHNNTLENLEYCTQLENERHSLTILRKTHTRDRHGKFSSTTI